MSKKTIKAARNERIRRRILRKQVADTKATMPRSTGPRSRVLSAVVPINERYDTPQQEVTDPAIIAQRIAEIPVNDRRTLTGKFFGDPLPGDRRRASWGG